MTRGMAVQQDRDGGNAVDDGAKGRRDGGTQERRRYSTTEGRPGQNAMAGQLSAVQRGGCPRGLLEPISDSQTAGLSQDGRNSGRPHAPTRQARYAVPGERRQLMGSSETFCVAGCVFRPVGTGSGVSSDVLWLPAI